MGAFGLVLLLAGCGGGGSAPERQEAEPAAVTVAPSPAPVAAEPRPKARSPASVGAESAARLVQTYYALIGARQYTEAYKLREPAQGAPSEADFAASFEPYAEYNATIGTPTEPVESAGWVYVEVPVQRYGRTKDGSPLASAGTITLRRPSGGGDWRIFTK